MPGKYVGTEEEESDGILFEDKMQTFTAALAEQFAKRNELEKNIRKNLKGIGYEFFDGPGGCPVKTLRKVTEDLCRYINRLPRFTHRPLQKA